MSNTVQNINQIKTGTCPHGLAPGACPICSMGGGTYNKKSERRKPGEMTYQECLAVWNMMKARALARKNIADIIEAEAVKHKTFEFKLVQLSKNMAIFYQKISEHILLKPMAFVIVRLIIPTIKIIQNIPNIITTVIDKLQEIRQKIIDLTNKLTAVFGEIKNFVQRKSAELINIIKSTFRKLFKIFKRNNTDDEDTQIDDDKKIFNLKNLIKKVYTIFNKKKDKNND